MSLHRTKYVKERNVCFAIKAVDIYVCTYIVTDLTSECLPHMLKRLTTRRGKLLNLYSDSATTSNGMKSCALILTPINAAEEGFE